MANFDIFRWCLRPDPELFFTRNDPNDPRLGEVVSSEPANYISSKVVLLGCPQDEGVRRNRARLGSALAPDEIRRSFYRLVAPSEFKFSLFDLGNLKIQPTLEETHEIQQEVVRQLIRDGKSVIVLGGGNDISYPDCSALGLEIPDLLAFNIDAHFDVRFDTPRNNGTPYFQLLEEGFIQPAKFYEMASLPFSTSSIHRQYLKEKGVNVFSLDDLHRQGVEEVFRAILLKESVSAIFWGFDLDAVQASDAPGVSAPAQIGLKGEELCRLAYMAGQDARSRLVEFSEVNPNYDIDQRTSRLVAVAMFYFLLGLNENF